MAASSGSDRSILRDFVEQVVAIAADPVQEERRDLWRRHNSFEHTRALIYTRAFAWKKMEASRCECEDLFLRVHENTLRNQCPWPPPNYTIRVAPIHGRELAEDGGGVYRELVGDAGVRELLLRCGL